MVPSSYCAVTKPVSSISVTRAQGAPQAQIATYPVTIDGQEFEIEAVALTDSNGNELLGQQSMADSVPVTLASDQAAIPVNQAPTSGNIATYPDVDVAGTATVVLATNPDRLKIILQNTGANNIRVGDSNVSPARGLRLLPNAVIVYDQPNCPPGPIYACAETGTSTVAPQEIES
jgi:hypothetical protein